jgi:hypothetical protein
MNPDDQAEQAHCKMLMVYPKEILQFKCKERNLSELGTKKALAIRISNNDQLRWIEDWKIISGNLS